jgi:phosphatidylserine/phosphatidylglycerophosphate/cardiolipin synthase-like enzyme
VQSLRTLPRFNFAELILPELQVAPVEFAPAGLFEIRDAIAAAIMEATEYFYAEDQYFWSVEVMGWLNRALRRRPELKVILVTGDYQPPGPPLPEQMPIALRQGLLPGLRKEQIARVAVYRRRGFVHAKTILVDDRWASIGSANLARRSLYSDVEHAIAVVEPDGTWVQQYRAMLWGEHAGLAPKEQGTLFDLRQALGMWEPAWSTEPGSPSLPDHFRRYPLLELPEPLVESDLYDLIADPDSRKPWYVPLNLV